MDDNMPKPQTDTEQRTDVNEIPVSKLQIRQNDLKEEPVEVTDSLIPSPMTKAPEGMIEKNNSDELSKAERKQEEEEEEEEGKYIRGHTWNRLVKGRRVSQNQTTQATVTLPEDKKIHKL